MSQQVSTESATLLFRLAPSLVSDCFAIYTMTQKNQPEKYDRLISAFSLVLVSRKNRYYKWKQSLFSRSPGPRKGGSEARMPKIKVNINRLKKTCMSHCTHKSIPDAKFESGSSFSFGDMTSQNFPQKKWTGYQIRLLTPGKRVKL